MIRPLLIAAVALPLLGAGLPQHGKRHVAAESKKVQKGRPATEDTKPAAISGDMLDAHFIADRVLVDAPLAKGGHVRFWTDTGGGGPVLLEAAVKRLGLTTVDASMPELGPNARQLSDRLRLKPSAFPTPPTPIFVTAGLLATSSHYPDDSDGLIGNNWFAGHIWTWDYPRGTLTVEPRDWQPSRRDKTAPIGFRPKSGDTPTLHFPRITIEIAGERVPMLLDTGATTVLTPAAARRLGGPRLRASSMIVADRIAAWRKAHPTWRAIENAQAGTGARMIEVPDVKIAGIEVGPVWFTERPNRNFREVMSNAMSGPIEGAIGGNAFHSLRMTVDYIHARAAFRQVADASDVKVDHVGTRSHRRQK